MGPQVQKITERIINDAKENAKTIIEEAHMSADMILEQQRELARQKAAKEVSSILDRAVDEVELAEVTEATEASRRASWMILSERERLVTQVLDEVKARLIAFSKSEKYAPFLQKLVVETGIALGGGRLAVLLNERDSAMQLGLTTLRRTIAKKTATETELQLSKEKTDTSGGVVVKTADGKILVDNTFEAMLKRSEKQLRLKIAKALFE